MSTNKSDRGCAVVDITSTGVRVTEATPVKKYGIVYET